MTYRDAIAACIAGLSLAAALPASADVLEFDQGNARWISGALTAENNATGAALTAQSGEAALLDEALAAQALPDHVLLNASLRQAAVPEAYAAKVAELAARFDLSPTLIEALVWQESRWRKDAVSPAGAQGLAQLMPGTARDLGVNPQDPFANLEGGARYLRQQLDRFDGDLEKSLAAYNAGPGRVIRAQGIPAIRETQNYVAAIMTRLSAHSRSQD